MVQLYTWLKELFPHFVVIKSTVADNQKHQFLSLLPFRFRAMHTNPDPLLSNRNNVLIFSLVFNHDFAQWHKIFHGSYEILDKVFSQDFGLT